jgi:two-component system, NtrC family, sensor histidine kinase AtoS
MDGISDVIARVDLHEARNRRPRKHGYVANLIVVLFLGILVPYLGFIVFVQAETTTQILQEKEDKLFGLARQLDNYLEEDFDAILREAGTLDASREVKISSLNKALRDVTDFVASGNPGVGVGYYHRELDAILTYGPSGEFGHTVGRSIGPGHDGLLVLSSGEPMVQTGELVRGNIMNCMWPIRRNGDTIGYIWSNETVDQVHSQIAPIRNRLVGLSILALMVIYVGVVLATRQLISNINRIGRGVERLVIDPSFRLPGVHGELNHIVDKINELLNNASFYRVHHKYLLDSVDSGVMAVSTVGTITTTNKALADVFGGPTEPAGAAALVGRHYSEAIPEALHAIVNDGIADRELARDTEVDVEGRIISVSSSRILDDSGNRIGILFVFRNVTLLKSYEARLRARDRTAVLGEMSLNVAHEVKNPLTSIKGFTQMLAMPEVGEEKRRHYISIIESELNRVNGLLNELLIYGGRSRLSLEEVQLQSLVVDVLEQYLPLSGDIASDVVSNPETDLTVLADRGKVQQLFGNLLKNAVEALDGQEEPRISVSFSVEGEEVHVEIRDNGSGIFPEHLHRVTDPFFTTKTEGSGFGLAICSKIVENHGGSLHISSAPGKGTAVTVVLPKVVPESAL